MSTRGPKKRAVIPGGAGAGGRSEAGEVREGAARTRWRGGGRAQAHWGPPAGRSRGTKNLRGEPHSLEVSRAPRGSLPPHPGPQPQLPPAGVRGLLVSADLFAFAVAAGPRWMPCGWEFNSGGGPPARPGPAPPPRPSAPSAGPAEPSSGPPSAPGWRSARR